MIEILLSLAFITLLGAMSPGPDFAIVTRYGLIGSRRSAFLASVGISLALLVHVTCAALGLAVILLKFPPLLTLIQVAGSSYLGYLGVRLLLSSKGKPSETAPQNHTPLLTGFLSNLLNPKTTLFMFGIFTQFITAGTSLPLFALYGLVIATVSLAWYSCLVLFMTHSYFKERFDRYQGFLMKGMGAALCTLAITVFLRSIV